MSSSVEAGHNSNENYFDSDQDQHVNGAAVYVEAGSIIMNSSSTLTLAGTVNDADSANILPALQGLVDVETIGSSTTALSANGISLIGSSTGSQTYTLGAPVVGARKVICLLTTTTTGLQHQVSSNSTGVSFGNTAANNQLTFDAIDECVVLIAASTTKWLIVSNVGSVGSATQST